MSDHCDTAFESGSKQREDPPKESWNRYSQKTVGYDIINTLPDHVLLTVFAQFDPVSLCQGPSRVCRRWHTLAHDWSLWETLKLIEGSTPQSVVDVVLAYKDVVTHAVIVAKTCAFLRESLGAVEAACPDLKALTIHASNFTEDFADIHYVRLTELPRLRQLSFTSADATAYMIVWNFFPLAKRAQFKQLIIPNSPLINDDLESIVDTVNDLQEAHLFILQSSDETLAGFMAKVRHSIVSLKLKFGLMLDTMRGIRALSPAPNLSEFRLRGYAFSEDSEVDVFVNAPKISSLIFKQCPMSTAQIDRLFAADRVNHLSGLKVLMMDMPIDIVEFQWICDLCLQLERLSLKIHDDFESQDLKPLSRLTRLKWLLLQLDALNGLNTVEKFLTDGDILKLRIPIIKLICLSLRPMRDLDDMVQRFEQNGYTAVYEVHGIMCYVDIVPTTQNERLKK